MRNKLLGVAIGTRDLPSLAGDAREALDGRGEPLIVACANPHSLVTARRDAEFRMALEHAGAIVADGIGCILGAKFAGVDVGPRITGSDVFLAFMRLLDARCGSAFFFGCSDEVLSIVLTRVRHDFPNVKIHGFAPPFRPWTEAENEAMLARIAAAQPDVLWVAMTAPKQEKWVEANRGRLQVPVIASVGAVFEYYAGTTHRAPPWICNLGFEWLYRLLREPKRLWRRTLVSAPVFLSLVIGERLRPDFRNTSR